MPRILAFSNIWSWSGRISGHSGPERPPGSTLCQLDKIRFIALIDTIQIIYNWIWNPDCVLSMKKYARKILCFNFPCFLYFHLKIREIVSENLQINTIKIIMADFKTAVCCVCWKKKVLGQSSYFQWMIRYQILLDCTYMTGLTLILIYIQV